MSEKMHWSEAEAVVRAYRAQQGLTSDVDVATLARALGTDIGEVRRLAGRKPRFVDRSGVLSAGIALAVVAFGALVAAPNLFCPHPLRTTSLIAPPPPSISRIVIVGDDEGKVHVLDGSETLDGLALGSYPGHEDTKL